MRQLLISYWMWGLGDSHYGKANRLDSFPSTEPYTIPEPTNPKTSHEDGSQRRAFRATPPSGRADAACSGRSEADEEEDVTEIHHYPVTTSHHHDTPPSRTSTSTSAPSSFSSVSTCSGQVAHQQVQPFRWEPVTLPDTEPQKRLQPSSPYLPLSTQSAHSLLPHHPLSLQFSSTRPNAAESKNSAHKIEVSIQVPSICTLWLLLKPTNSLAEVCPLVERYVLELYRTAVRVDKLQDLTFENIDLPLSCLLGQLPSFKKDDRTQMFLSVEYTTLTRSSLQTCPTTTSSPPDSLLYPYHHLPDNNSTIPIKRIHPSTPSQCLPEYSSSPFHRHADGEPPGSNTSPASYLHQRFPPLRFSGRLPSHSSLSASINTRSTRYHSADSVSISPFSNSDGYPMGSFSSSFDHLPKELPIYCHQQQLQSGGVGVKGYAGRKRTNGECMNVGRATKNPSEPAEKKNSYQRGDAKKPRNSGLAAEDEDGGDAKTSDFRGLSTAPTPAPTLPQYRLKVVDAVPQNVTQNKEFCFSTCVMGDGPDLEKAFQSTRNPDSSEERRPLTNLPLRKRITEEEEERTLMAEKGEGELKKATVNGPLQLTVWEEASKAQVSSKDVAIRSFIMDAKNRTVVFFVKIKKNSYYGRKRYILRIEGKDILFNQVEPFESTPFVVSAKNKAHITRGRSASDPSLRPLLRVSTPSTGQDLLHRSSCASLFPPNQFSSSTLSPSSFASVSLSLPESPAEDFP
ncbi:hypothetical protein QOT17_001559 [Balamuthia mandrillaris]